ncbi:hypothetical protein T265_10143 [Opisthorchis viverrini]|uniref:Uncharacterized protein n=1 Tax=Opisthorchis viverrini TaxID=6198 RepID=A0A074ZED5_OPIVI|nr:hypothetical protein T265_10143 [Opisthorchis viverrini]KER21575.1 hypothetical protein T265_10143 [Opisthorchis viverrini]
MEIKTFRQQVSEGTERQFFVERVETVLFELSHKAEKKADENKIARGIFDNPERFHWNGEHRTARAAADHLQEEKMTSQTRRA